MRDVRCLEANVSGPIERSTTRLIIERPVSETAALQGACVLSTAEERDSNDRCLSSPTCRLDPQRSTATRASRHWNVVDSTSVAVAFNVRGGSQASLCKPAHPSQLDRDPLIVYLLPPDLKDAIRRGAGDFKCCDEGSWNYIAVPIGGVELVDGVAINGA